MSGTYHRDSPDSTGEVLGVRLTADSTTFEELGPTSRQRLAQWVPLFLISSIGLYVELAVIRWISGEIRLFSYFKNLPLLAAFLGLAIGFGLVGKRRKYLQTFPPLLALLVILVVSVNRITADYPLAYPGGGDEFLWNAAQVSDVLLVGLFLGAVLVFFLMIMFMFIPLGLATGEEMARHKPVPAYIVNILASLFGVWVFSGVSYMQTPPVIWFALGALGLMWYLSMKQALNWISVLILAGTLFVLLIADRNTHWSPYQRLNVTEEFMARGDTGEPVNVGYRLEVQQSFHQHGLNLSNEFRNQTGYGIPELEANAENYNLPYRVIPPGSNILVVGAGMGNDVAAALRNGSGKITAIEIDPAILDFGKNLHPEKPYADPRVKAIVNDARSFFNNNTAQYDAVVFGLLDSHTLLSSLSSVRLDSFVYTIESFQQVKEHLTAEGVAVVSFLAVEPWIKERLGRILTKVFGSEAVYIHQNEFGTTFVAGNVAPETVVQSGATRWAPSAEFDDLPIPTDNWPYLYLREQKIPAVYGQALLVIGIVCLALIARSFPETLRPDWSFWFLGAAFLLVEFKSITELALLFGSTWLVNALAISGVLIMVLFANLVVLKQERLNLRLVYALLFTSLFLLFFLPINQLGELAVAPRLLVSTLLLSSPLFFAGIIFSESLRRAGETSRPLASNLTGTMMGGFMEYGSLMWGIKSLYPLAILVYAGAFITSRLKRNR
jgi:hypothetical protein